VLVPIDFSEESLRGLDYALDWALRAPCELHLVHVVETQSVAPSVGGQLAHDFVELERIADAELRRLVPNQEGRSKIQSIERHIVAGRPTATILRIAARLEVDLIIIGSHGRGRALSLLFGSVAERVIRDAVCPVLCVKRGHPGPDMGSPHWDRIVCAVDFSDCSRRAMLAAVKLARHLNVELQLLHVHQAAAGIPGLDAEAASRLAECKQLAEARGAMKVTTAVVVGSPSAEIVRYVRHDGCDLLVVGTHGHTAPLRLLMGSVAEKVVRTASCPVLTVHPGDEATVARESH
jgi:nucleotide-binding universal stress UspA family protein